ncbi:hypothetical protein QE152_g36994 [Popillia japonica]|uniref:Uncharacterized protein n=1 Tax=Popillia japonica TaxID=7064 RepID=A0AAW1IBW9_POPJA
MHEAGEYPDTDLSDEALDDSNVYADYQEELETDDSDNYQEELETDDSDSNDSVVPVTASTSKLHLNRSSITTRSPLAQSSTSKTTSPSSLP